MSLLLQLTETDARPVTLSQAKHQLRIDGNESDGLVGQLIDAATGAVSEMLGLSLVEQQWSYSVPSVGGDLKLPKGPVKTVDSIAYYDRDDVAQTATVSDFYLFKDNDMAILRPKPGMSWPDTAAREDALSVTFTVGWAGLVPAEVKQAVLVMVSHMHDTPHAATDRQMVEVPYAVRDLVALHRRGWIA